MNHTEKLAELVNEGLNDCSVDCFNDEEIDEIRKEALEEAGLMLVPKSDSEWENHNNA